MRMTADHGEIRRWVEANGGRPGRERPTGRLAIAFDEACDSLSWDEFFDRFDRQGLAFVYEPDDRGEGVRSAKLVSR